MSKVWLSSEFEIEVCIKCEVTFALTVEYAQHRRRDHKSFRCPNGHSQYYPQKSDVENLKEQVKHCKADAAFWQNSYGDKDARLEEVQRSRSAYKGHITRIKKASAPKNGKAP